jgi:hypothetical protein
MNQKAASRGCCVCPRHVIRVIVVVFASGMFLHYWAMWRTRNLPASLGGSYSNPFNDRRRFCCIYNKAPCALDVLCASMPSGTTIEAHHLNTSTGPLYVWFWYFLAIVACTVHLWSFGALSDGESEMQTVFAVVCVGCALFLGATRTRDLLPDLLV